MPKLIILMGVSGSGKTVIGTALAKRTSAIFIDGDDLHPQSNIDKMAAGIPLTDDDRLSWLELLASLGHKYQTNNTSCIIACSALKYEYRELLRSGNNDIGFIYLKGSFELIFSRIQQRHHQYMPASLLQSQFDALEEPLATETDVLVVSINRDLNTIINEIENAKWLS
ncbi:gluconokinase [Pedobacter sandarakinus]|uniref:gluconokinase n=1 Tax=Pedobacter sandarakinus TaxID=353156 RepID=UPI0022462460|nr:gluconokinase [Pedobacter sandarakinus]MCX2576266.1 gluconokinase [Pedobacter sandarakinus]